MHFNEEYLFHVFILEPKFNVPLSTLLRGMHITEDVGLD
jgi:hypothetical protein